MLHRLQVTIDLHECNLYKKTKQKFSKDINSSVRPQNTRVFRIFVTSTRLINREFLVFPSVHFLKKMPHFLAVAVPLYCPFLVNICKS